MHPVRGFFFVWMAAHMLAACSDSGVSDPHPDRGWALLAGEDGTLIRYDISADELFVVEGTDGSELGFVRTTDSEDSVLVAIQEDQVILFDVGTGRERIRYSTAVPSAPRPIRRLFPSSVAAAPGADAFLITATWDTEDRSAPVGSGVGVFSLGTRRLERLHDEIRPAEMQPFPQARTVALLGWRPELTPGSLWLQVFDPSTASVTNVADVQDLRSGQQFQLVPSVEGGLLLVSPESGQVWAWSPDGRVTGPSNLPAPGTLVPDPSRSRYFFTELFEFDGPPKPRFAILDRDFEVRTVIDLNAIAAEAGSEVRVSAISSVGVVEDDGDLLVVASTPRAGPSIPLHPGVIFKIDPDRRRLVRLTRTEFFSLRTVAMSR